MCKTDSLCRRKWSFSRSARFILAKGNMFLMSVTGKCRFMLMVLLLNKEGCVNLPELPFLLEERFKFTQRDVVYH